MKDFDEAFLGQMANQVGETLRYVKRRVRELGSITQQQAYSAEQASAARIVHRIRRAGFDGWPTALGRLT